MVTMIEEIKNRRSRQQTNECKTGVSNPGRGAGFCKSQQLKRNQTKVKDIENLTFSSKRPFCRHFRFQAERNGRSMKRQFWRRRGRFGGLLKKLWTAGRLVYRFGRMGFRSWSFCRWNFSRWSF